MGAVATIAQVIRCPTMRSTQLFILFAGALLTKADDPDGSTATAAGRFSFIVAYLSVCLPVVGVAIGIAGLCCYWRTARLDDFTPPRTQHHNSTVSRDSSTIKTTINELYTSLIVASVVPSAEGGGRSNLEAGSSATLKTVENDLYTSLELSSSGSRQDLSETLKAVYNDLYTSVETVTMEGQPSCNR